MRADMTQQGYLSLSQVKQTYRVLEPRINFVTAQAVNKIKKPSFHRSELIASYQWHAVFYDIMNNG